MIKKTLSYSIKAIKLSTWIGAISVLLVALIVAFFLLFPALIKAPIETQLSQISGMDVKLSNIGFDFRRNNIALKIANIQITSPEQQPIAQIEQLHWHINFFNLFDDIYHPSKVYIDTLTFYLNDSLFDINQITQSLLDNLHFLESLNIDKTLIKNYPNIVLSPLTFSRENDGFVLKIPQQNIGAKKVNINAKLPIAQFARNGLLELPISVQNSDFTLSSKIRLYRQNEDNFFEWNGVIERMDAVNMGQYFLAEWVGRPTHQWLNNAFVSGEVEAIKIKLKQNLSRATPFEFNLSAHSNNMTLFFHPDWQNLQHLEADIVMDTENIAIQVNTAQLNDLDLSDIQVQIPNFTAETANIEITGEINQDSAALMRFLSLAPLGKALDEALQQFKISGKAIAQVSVVLPLNEAQPTIDVDLEIQNNRLSVLDGGIVVEDYNSDGAYHQGRITAKGVGNIRNNIFEISINPNPNAKVDFALEIGQRVNNFKTYITKTAKNIWFAEVDSPNVKSKLFMDFNSKTPQLKLQDLRIKTQKSNIKILELRPDDLPNMHLQAKNIRIDDYQFPDFKADLHSQQNTLNINNLEFEGIGVNQNNLSFNGHWLQGVTTLIATAKGKKLSDFLQQLKIQEQVKGGAFDFDLRLFCVCNPWDMNLKNISGYTSINVKEGEFSDQDPNIGRILSLLNIESIAKRLKLKVDDLTHKGFVYDDIQVDAYLNDARLELVRFQVNASSSTIRLSGNSDIVNQQYDVLATVRPTISNSVPIATYLAGGGLAGLGVWLADKVLFDGKIMDSVVDSVAEFNYKITGSWDNPVIE